MSSCMRVGRSDAVDFGSLTVGCFGREGIGLLAKGERSTHTIIYIIAAYLRVITGCPGTNSGASPLSSRAIDASSASIFEVSRPPKAR